MVALKNVRVIEVASFYPAPFCTQILAMLGADVTKVEPPGGDPARALGSVFAALNRGKKSIVINLKSDEGVEKFMELVKDSDVIVEGFRPGVARKLGIDYESVREVNPSIIYCSISAFGQHTKLRDVPGHDLNVLALAGVLEVSGFGEPRDPNVQLADFSSSLFAAIAILGAIIERERTGKGRYIDIGMFQSAIFSIPLHSTPLLNGMNILPVFSSNPGYGIYKTRDGYITVGIIAEEHFWKRLCEALEIDGGSLFESFSRFDEIKNRIQEKFAEMSTDEAVNTLISADVPVMEVMSLKDVRKIEEMVGETLTEVVEYGDERFVVVKPPFDSACPSRAPRLGEGERDA